MRRFQCVILGLGLLLLSAAAVSAQSGRLGNLAERLASDAEELADRSYSDYTNSYNSNRGDVETVYLAQQFSASANLFRRMVNDRRRESELRDAAAILSDLLRRANRSSYQSSRWSNVQRTLDDIQRELNGRGGGGRDDDGGGRTSGRLRWSGTVDDNVNLVISDDRVEVRTIGGSEYSNANYNFTSPLPRRRVTVNVNKLSGRGEVRVLQQPSRDNNYTAVIEIRDSKSGAKDYEIEVTW
jgi:hypothetical protein